MSTIQLNWTTETSPIPTPTVDYSWYAVRTRLRFEKKVAAQLQRKGIKTFLPLVKQVHRWSDRRQVVDVPLFPGYGFVRLSLNASTRFHILQTVGLHGFVGCNGEAVPIPNKQIEDIQQVLAQQVPCAMYPFLKAGQRVRIRGGCLDGLEGILADRTSDTTLLISIETIGRTIAVRVEGYDIEPI